MKNTIPTIAVAAACATATPGIALAAGQDAGDAPAPAAEGDDAARAAIAAALQGAGYAKLAVSESYAKTHAWAHDAAEIGFEAPEGTPARVDVADGAITLTFDAPGTPDALAGKTLRLLPSDTGDGMVHWRCEAPGLAAELRPKGCE